MALIQEELAVAVGRGDNTLRFTATAGEENGPYRIDGYTLTRAGERHVADRMAVDGAMIVVHFPVALQAGDQVELPA